MNWIGLRGYAWSLLVAIVLTAIVAGIASASCCEDIGVLLLPGELLAAVAFPEGVNSYGASCFFS